MIVDIHTHLWERPQQLGEGTAERLRARSPGPWARLDGSTNAYDEAMRPVDRAVILGFHSLHLGASIPHEQVAGYIKRQPGRYVGFGGVDPLAPGHLDSARKAIDLGLSGIVISPAACACHPTHTRAVQLYEQCQKRNVPILIHTGTHMATSAVMEFSQPHLWDEVGRMFPDLKLVLAQVGHPWVEPALLLMSKHRNFYADLSDLTSRPWQLYNVLLMATQMHVTDHLLLGSDFPFLTPQEAIYNIYSVNHHTQGTSLPTISRQTLQEIVERDTLKCLGIKDNGPSPRNRLDVLSEAPDAGDSAAGDGESEPSGGRASLN